MAKIGAGEIIYDLRKKIQEIRSDLNQLGVSPSEIPEMITSANLLRSNEFLSKTNEKKSELISAYEQYSESLETMLSSVFEIQKDLKDILTEQSSMIFQKKTPLKPKKNSKPKKTPLKPKKNSKPKKTPLKPKKNSKPKKTK